jgi:hypothetical protein
LAAALETVGEYRVVGGALVEMDTGVDSARHGDSGRWRRFFAADVEMLAEGHDPAAHDAVSPFITLATVAMVVLRSLFHSRPRFLPGGKRLQGACRSIPA